MDAIFFLIIPLEEVRNFKLNELQKINNNIMIEQNHINKKIQLLNNNIVDIRDCFDYHQKEEYLFGNNAMYCDNCKKQLPYTFQTFLYSLPLILIINIITFQNIFFNIYHYIYLKQNFQIL